MRRIHKKVLTESQEMQLLAQYLDAKGYLWCHVPNEGKRSPVTGSRLKREGVKRGVPDVLVFAPKRIAIELKKVKGSKTTDEQRAWLGSLSDAGWATFLAFGADSAIHFIEHSDEIAGKEKVLKEYYNEDLVQKLLARCT